MKMSRRRMRMRGKTRSGKISEKKEEDNEK